MCISVYIYMLIQVGESNRPSFRPGLEGGSSDDEASNGRNGPALPGIEHRRSAEGQVINPPVTGVTCSINNFPQSCDHHSLDCFGSCRLLRISQITVFPIKATWVLRNMMCKGAALAFFQVFAVLCLFSLARSLPQVVPDKVYKITTHVVSVLSFSVGKWWEPCLEFLMVQHVKLNQCLPSLSRGLYPLFLSHVSHEGIDV